MGTLQRQQHRPESAGIQRSAKPRERQSDAARSPLETQQQALGNQAVQRLISSHAVQPKLTVASPTDSYEQEAESVANDVMSSPQTARRAPAIQRLPDKVSRATAKDEDKKKPPEAKGKEAGGKDAGGKDAGKKDAGKDKKKEDDKVKRMAADDKKEDDEDKVHRAAAETAVPDVTPEIEHSIDRQSSGGRPLPESLRSFYEPRFGRDLSSVRVHTDAQAARSAQDLKAQAFTRGQDVYFASGTYQPHSDSGRRLIAHELTHTLQQSGGGAPLLASTPAPAASPAQAAPVTRSAAPAMVQRQTPGTASAAGSTMSPVTGVYNDQTEPPTVLYESIDVPAFKAAGHRGTLYGKGHPKRMAKYTRGSPKQIDVWNKLPTTNIVSKLKEKYETATKTPSIPPPKVYVFQGPGADKSKVTDFEGDLEGIASKMLIPTWGKNGAAPKKYDVDHIVELQLANWNAGGSEWANTLENMELLERGINRSSGPTIAGAITKKAQAFADSVKGQTTPKGGPYPASASAVKDKCTMEFEKAEGGAPGSVTDDDFWVQDDITKGLQVEKVTYVNAASLGSPEKVIVFPGPAGSPKEFPVKGGVGAIAGWLKPFVITKAEFKVEPGSESTPDLGTITYTLPKDDPNWKADIGEKTLTVKRLEGAKYAGVIDIAAILSDIASLESKAFSPITVDTFEITPDKGISVSGNIDPQIEILSGGIDFELTGNTLTLSKTFEIGDFKFPKPFKVEGSSLTVFVSAGGTNAIGVKGQVDFSVDKVGSGFLGAAIGTQGFGISGKFNFDPKLFEPPSNIAISYLDKVWAMDGTLSIGKDKITGIEKGTVHFAYKDKTLTADGSADLSIPGVKKAAIAAKYAEDTGLAIKGKVDLDSNPVMSSGSMEAEITQTDSGWAVKAGGEATSSIAGFGLKLKGSYEKGLTTISASGTYTKGLLTGTITVGATNQAIDDKGKPTGEKTKKMLPFGDGSVTIKFAPWLQGTATVWINQLGKIKVSGEIGITSAVDLFPLKKIDPKQLVPIPSIQIPLPIPGVLANVGGSITAGASFGPAQLKDVKVHVDYDPEAEDSTHVTGTATLAASAQATLGVSVFGGLGIGGAGVASVTGNVKVGAELGVKAEASATADIDYTPGKGAIVDGKLEASAGPVMSFTVGLLGQVKLVGLTVYEPQLELARFSYGPKLTFGVTLPIHYEQNKSFEIKFADAKFQKPEFNAVDTIKDLLKEKVKF